MTIKTKAYIAWLAVSIIWGTTYLVIRIGVQEIPLFLFSGLQWLTAVLIFIILKFPEKKEIYKIAVVGIILIGIGNGLITFGGAYPPP